jgi:hypothetical protein
MARRKRYTRKGSIGVGLDAFLPPAVGGTAAMGTTLMLRGFVKPYQRDEDEAIQYDEAGKAKENFAFKHAGLIGAGAGIVGSAVLGPFRGWGSALSGAITAALTGVTSELYNAVVPAERRPLPPLTGYGFQIARRSPYGQLGQPFVYDRGGARLGYGQSMYNRPAPASLPENVTAFPAAYGQKVNAAAFGGRTWQ